MKDYKYLEKLSERELRELDDIWPNSQKELLEILRILKNRLVLFLLYWVYFYLLFYYFLYLGIIFGGE